MNARLVDLEPTMDSKSDIWRAVHKGKGALLGWDWQVAFDFCGGVHSITKETKDLLIHSSEEEWGVR